MVTWRFLQLADSAFPTGGFAHSGGLEAAAQAGEAGQLAAFARTALWQAGFGALPLVREAWLDPGGIGRLDARADVFLANHVANRASRTQGAAFYSTCARVFPDEAPRLPEGLCMHPRRCGAWSSARSMSSRRPARSTSGAPRAACSPSACGWGWPGPMRPRRALRARPCARRGGEPLCLAGAEDPPSRRRSDLLHGTHDRPYRGCTSPEGVTKMGHEGDHTHADHPGYYHRSSRPARHCGRAFTVGLWPGGREDCAGVALCRLLRVWPSLGVVTNDTTRGRGVPGLATRPRRAYPCGGNRRCPHAAIREDISHTRCRSSSR
jgi:hypothetical protein